MTPFEKALDEKFGEGFSEMSKDTHKFSEVTCCNCGMIVGYIKGTAHDEIYCEGCMEESK